MKHIAITGAAGQIAYSLLFCLSKGALFQEPLVLHLCDLPQMKSTLEGLVCELEDCAFPFLHSIQIHTNPFEAFKWLDLALLVGAKPRTEGMERKDLLQENAAIFKEQGQALEQGGNKEVRVIVVGNPCNTNCLLAMHHAPSISRKNFHAMMRLDQNRAVWQLAKKTGVGVEEIQGITIWGNHSRTQVPDFSHVRLQGKKMQAEEIDLLHQHMQEIVKLRGEQVMQKRGKSSAASAAYAVLDAAGSLFSPTPAGQWYTSAVCSDQNPYGISPDLIFGFPCYTKADGSWEIVPQLLQDPFIRRQIKESEEELLREKEMIAPLLERSVI